MINKNFLILAFETDEDKNYFLAETIEYFSNEFDNFEIIPTGSVNTFEVKI